MIHQLIHGLNYGFIFAPLAMAVFISYRLLRFTDLTVDGTFVLGGMLTAVLLRDAVGVLPATLAAVGAGAVAGAVTGLLNTRLGVRRILAGILVMTTLYSVNSFIIGGWQTSIPADTSLMGVAARLATAIYGSTDRYEFLGMTFFPEYLMSLLLHAGITLVFGALLLVFFHTRMGLAIRGAGSNEDAVKALGANVPVLVTVALALSNALAALSGSLYAQELHSIEFKDGVGSIVIGLACIMIGQALFRRKRFSLQLFSAVVGALFYRLLIAVVVIDSTLREDVKLYTSVIVLLAILLPGWLRRGRRESTVKEA